MTFCFVGILGVGFIMVQVFSQKKKKKAKSVEGV